MGLSVSARLLETTALIAVASPVVAQTRDGQSGTGWTFGTNWNPDGVPVAAATATIDSTGATDPTIAAGDAVTVDTVVVSGGTLTIGGSLTATTWVDISGFGTVRVNDGTAPDGVITSNVNVQSDGTLSLAGAVTGDLDVNGGALDLDGGSITGLLRLSGGGVVTAISDTTLGGADIGVNSNEMGTFTTADGVTLTINAPLRRSAGSDTIFGTAGVDGTVVVASNIVTVANDSAVTVAGGTLALGSGLSANSYLGLFTGTSVTVNSGAAVDIRGFNTTIGNLAGTGRDLVLTGATENTLSGKNTYTGATTVNGVLTISTGTALGDTAAGTTVTSSGAKTLNGGRIEGTLAGTGATTIPNGTTDLNGSITGGLATIVTGGVLNLTGDSLVSELGFVGDELTASADATLTGLAVGVRGTGQSGIISVVKVQGGTQILSGPNTYSGTTTISAGTLQVGNGGTTGTLGNGDVINNAALVIDRSNALTLANAISGTGAVTVTGGGTVTLTGANTFTGGLTVEEGTVALSGWSALADTNAMTVELDEILALINSERMGAVTNCGTLDLSGGNGVAGTILTVNGDYAAESDLVLDVVLGGDGSATDRLVVEGDTAGTTDLFVVNQGGTGALTGTGILLVDVQGTSDGAFVLANGDTVLPGNETGLSVGSFVYVLRNIAGDWFLQSQLQAFAVAYEAVPQLLLGLTRAASLAQRLAGRQMLTAPQAEEDGLTASSKGAMAVSAMTGAWLSLRGNDIDAAPEGSKTGLCYDQSTWRVQGGFDMLLSEGAGETTVLVDAVALDANAQDLTAELGIGGSIDWQHGRSTTSLFGEVNAIRGIGGGDLSGMSGTARLRLSW